MALCSKALVNESTVLNAAVMQDDKITPSIEMKQRLIPRYLI